MMSSPLFQIKHSLTACLLGTSSYITAVARPQVRNRNVTWYVTFIHCHLGCSGANVDIPNFYEDNVCMSTVYAYSTVTFTLLLLIQ